MHRGRITRGWNSGAGTAGVISNELTRVSLSRRENYFGCSPRAISLRRAHRFDQAGFDQAGFDWTSSRPRRRGRRRGAMGRVRMTVDRGAPAWGGCGTREVPVPPCREPEGGLRGKRLSRNTSRATQLMSHSDGECKAGPMNCGFSFTLGPSGSTRARVRPLNLIRLIWKGECSVDRVRLFGITKPGLLAMTISVVALWGCIAMENAALRQGASDARACARALQELRERSVPASAPVWFHRQLPKMS